MVKQGFHKSPHQQECPLCKDQTQTLTEKNETQRLAVAEKYDYTIDDYGFVLAQNDANRGGTWNTGVGGQLHSNTGFQVNLGHNIATPYQIIRFEIDINVTALPGSGNIGLSNLAETQFSTPYVIPTTGTQTISITKDITWAGGSGWKLYAVALGASQLQFTLQSIRITGSGTKEAGVPDC